MQSKRRKTRLTQILLNALARFIEFAKLELRRRIAERRRVLQLGDGCAGFGFAAGGGERIHALCIKSGWVDSGRFRHARKPRGFIGRRFRLRC